jgi:hypothetical protein
MIDLRIKKCLSHNCDKQPSFNYTKEKTALKCYKHKLDKMIDVKNKKCLYQDCDKHPCFNYAKEITALYCS